MSEANTYKLPWDDFRLVRRIGSGGYGEVWEAVRNVSETIEEHSAIKIITIPESRAQLEQIKRNLSGFGDSTETVIKQVVDDCIHEIEVMVSLKHSSSHIVTMEDYKIVKEYDSEIKSDKYQIFIREELLKPIHEFSPTGMLDEKSVIQMGEDICNALMVLEEKHYVHRDVTSSNILVSTEGGQIVYKLSDFGIAKHLESLNSFLSRRGKSFFMPPELIAREGNAKTTDTYGLGMTMFWYLNGNRMPFVVKRQIPLMKDFEEAEYIRVNNKKDIPKPENASDPLAKIVLKAVAYNPDDRYQSAGEMLEDLKNLSAISVDGTNAKTDSANVRANFITLDNSSKPKTRTPKVDTFVQHKPIHQQSLWQTFKGCIIPTEKNYMPVMILSVIAYGICSIIYNNFVYPANSLSLFTFVKNTLLVVFCYVTMNYVTNRFTQHPSNPDYAIFLCLAILVFTGATLMFPAIDEIHWNLRIQFSSAHDYFAVTPAVYAEIMPIILFAIYHRNPEKHPFGGEKTLACVCLALSLIMVTAIAKYYSASIVIGIEIIICSIILIEPLFSLIKKLCLPIAIMVYLFLQMTFRDFRLSSVMHIVDLYTVSTKNYQMYLLLVVIYFALKVMIIAYTIKKVRRLKLNQFQKIVIYGAITFIVCHSATDVYMMRNYHLFDIYSSDMVSLAVVSGLIQAALSEADNKMLTGAVE